MFHYSQTAEATANRRWFAARCDARKDRQCNLPCGDGYVQKDNSMTQLQEKERKRKSGS